MVRLLLPFVAPSSGRNHFVYLTLRNAVWLKNVPVAQLTVLSTYMAPYMKNYSQNPSILDRNAFPV